MPNTERFYICKGSVFYVENSNNVEIKTENIVGEYQNEGFGSIQYNPIFLDPKAKNENDLNSGYRAKFKLTTLKGNDNASQKEDPETGIENDDPLLSLLESRLEKYIFEKEITEEVNKTISKWSKLKSEVTRTQWNNIRNAAQNSYAISDLETKIANETNGIMTCGRDKESWKVYKDLLLEEVKNKSNDNWLPYFSKLAAEMSKKAKSK